MNGFEEIDWEATTNFLKRFGALIFAALWALAVRRKKKRSTEETLEDDPAENPLPNEDPSTTEVVAIGPGTDATKLSSQYSQQK